MTASDISVRGLTVVAEQVRKAKDFDWFDSVPAAYARNLSRMLVGVSFDIGDNEQGITEETITVAKVGEISVGIDSAGIFCSVTVHDEDGRDWFLYGDGTIADTDDRTVGQHRLVTKPEVAA
jgi:hypothetical protein